MQKTEKIKFFASINFIKIFIKSEEGKMKKGLALILALLLCLSAVELHAASAGDSVPTLYVDMSAQDHDILHGSAGFLYGISNEGVPDVNTLTPLKPKVLATKGALGTEHPYGDALDVADEFFEAGGEQVQMYTSNYYGVFGVTANANDYGSVLKNIIAPKVAEWKDSMREKYPDIDSRIVYIPINEGTPVNGVSGFNAAWKIYFDSIRASDPKAVIAGPNDAVYRGHSSMRDFLNYCKNNNCLPDIVTWHELQVGCLDTMDDHIADYRSICRELAIDEKQVVINEYADFADCGVPGRLVNWIARLEDNEVYGCLPFWHQANNLNDLTADANQGNGAWQVYKWYGDMSGKTLALHAENTTFDGFYGLASIDENKRSAFVLCGGVDGKAEVVLENLDESAVFKEADRVKVKVEASYFTGYHGAAYEPETVMEGVFEVSDGKVTINLKDMLFSAAYNITVTETAEPVSSPSVGSFRTTYEAEDALLLGDLIIDHQNSPLETPRYFCSGGKRVGGIDEEGDGIEYTISVPVDGLYKLSFIYGNGVGSTRNNADTHKPLNITQKLIIDGEEKPLLLPNTLFYSMEGMADEYVNLTSGRHSVAVMYDGEAGGFHDALYVSYAGAYGEERADFNKIYQAENADFNTFSGKTPVRTETESAGYLGSGYVTGLDALSVEDGGGIRWIVDVEDSGYYHLSFRYMAPSEGKLRLYLDNTNLTYSNLLSEIDLAASSDWTNAHTTLFLKKGINIVDIDTSAPAFVDYMRVMWANLDVSQVFEAEDADGSFKTAKASGGELYVTEMEGSKVPQSYLELSVSVPEAGLYKMQVFQSNNDLCGTHSYNIKIIDRFATFEVNGDVDNAKRYFFPNTFSDDTFMERTIPITLNAGENKIKIYNDDSWEVLWGGSTSQPGTNRLVNFTPNFDKFIISPASLDTDIGEIAYPIKLSSTEGGYIYCDKNAAYRGESATVYLIPDGKVDSLTVNGDDLTYLLTTSDGSLYTAEITISGDTEVFAKFTKAQEGDFEIPDLSDNGSILINGQRYKIIGENMFSNGDFEDNSGKNMDQWYVGKNANGHPSNGGYLAPRIKSDGSLENLTPLSESSLLIKNAYEPSHGENVFYFGRDNSRPDGLKHYLVEAVGLPWESNAWNGEHSLLAFVPIKPDTKYYFCFNAYTLSGAASVRYGAINMESYIPSYYAENASLDFSGGGYMDCTNGGHQNVGGSWKTYDSVIESGNGDYFFFNAYWLQMAEYLCLGGFELYEISSEPMFRINEIKNPPTLLIRSGDELDLPKTADAFDENGHRHTLPITWLNDKDVDTASPGVYAATGYVTLPEGCYYDGEPLVRQRIVVSGAFEAEITRIKTDRGIAVSVKANMDISGTLYAVCKTGDNVVKVQSKMLSLSEGEVKELSFDIDSSLYDEVKLFFWSGALSPLAEAK